ncbi:MAG: DUF2752 domain-containing protein [Bacteroidales bacterium]|nr:DUF2752 domain-containing protein [Lachnoclostridium sp.]MCM1385674.1 DUF2752 domain-containing protein [Lachnoclostridium sp.]MCM1466445.1 DUF2752 domain-containing protein [Bacteroidales bacterium]
MMKKRLLSVLRIIAILLIAGCAYGFWVYRTGIALPCPFRFLTGLKCPGCGVTHMCLALLHFDFVAAFAANPALLLISPWLALVFAQYCITYIRKGCLKMHPFQNVSLWICIAILLLYGIARNLFSLP